MQETALDCQSIALRIQRRLDEALDRQVGGTEADRQGTLVDTLRRDLTDVPAERRGDVLGALRALHPERAALPSGPSAEHIARLAELEAEVARLRAELAARPDAPGRPAPASGEMERALIAVVVGTDAELGALLADPALPSRVRAVARELVDFAERMGRVFLGATEDHTMAGHVRGLTADVVYGRSEPDAFAGALARISRQIGAQLVAFREACEGGARDLLRQLAPAALEAEVGRAGAGVSRFLFFHKECWDLFAQRHEALRMNDELFDTYFNGPYRSALLRLAEGGTGDAEAT